MDRRAILEEVYAERVRMVATAKSEPSPSSPLWRWYGLRLLVWLISPSRTLLEERRGWRAMAVIALAYMEAVDVELGGEPALSDSIIDPDAPIGSRLRMPFTTEPPP